eukprot:2360689-Prymnesium_polylepis.2
MCVSSPRPTARQMPHTSLHRCSTTHRRALARTSSPRPTALQMPHLYTDEAVTVAYALGALRNSLGDIDDVERIEASGALPRLQELAECGHPQIEEYAAACLQNVATCRSAAAAARRLLFKTTGRGGGGGAKGGGLAALLAKKREAEQAPQQAEQDQQQLPPQPPQPPQPQGQGVQPPAHPPLTFVDDGAGAVAPAAAASAPVTLPQKVARIKEALGLEASLSPAAAVAEANAVMGIEAEGALISQVDRLLQDMGLVC